MNYEQARKNLETATAIRKEAERKLEDHYELVNGANEAEKAAESILLDIVANEPTEDKIIDMSHFINSGLIVEFYNEDSIRHLGYLQNVLDQGEYRYRNNNNSLYKYCTPMCHHDYASKIGWMKPPIPEGYEIDCIRFTNRCTFDENNYSDTNWSEVAMFRIVAIKDGFKHE